LAATSDLEDITNGLEALLFGIYILAVTSLSKKDFRRILEEEKATLLARHRAGAIQALQMAGFLKSSELVVLHAFFLFLVSHLFSTKSISWQMAISLTKSSFLALESGLLCRPKVALLSNGYYR
jgi:uncharacterized membrane protein